MHKIKQSMFTTLWICISALLYSALSWGALSAKQELHSYLKKLQSMDAQFTQRQLGTEAVTSQGQFSLQRPGQFTWQVFAPIEQVIVISNHQMWVYDPALQQAMKKPFHTKPSEKTNTEQITVVSPMVLFLDDSPQALDAFTVTRLRTKHQLDCFQLIPKASKRILMKKVRMCFNPQGAPEHLWLSTATQKVHWTFHHIKLNQPIDQAIFEFAPPEGTDII